ncbi:MAG: ABC transporter ATP-binding protein, partial [Pseudomonadota bacterium]
MASSTSSPPKLTMGQFFGFFFRILAPEASFYWLAIIYGVGISLLSLATPISVQMLINTVANTALTAPLILLSATLFGLLMISGLLNALRVHLMELFGRRFYARMVAEIALRSIYAQNPFFSDTSRSALFNRYFDIVVVQKSMPVLFIGGFTVILQAGVGFVLVSLYHPLFLVFNLVLVALIWIIWLIWGASAIRSAIDLSHAKHATAEWLESLAASDGFFKSQKRIDYALDIGAGLVVGPIEGVI